MSAQLLIVEDDRALNMSLALHFSDAGYQVAGVTGIAEAITWCGAAIPDIVLLDQHFPDGRGIDLLRDIAAMHRDAKVIMMTGAHDLELAIQAIKAGAFDFVHKPLQLDELSHVVGRALEHQRLMQQVLTLTEPTQATLGRGMLVGGSRAMLAISKEIGLIADSPARVLITGETGTGKELIARAIHGHSRRRGLFLAVNCAALVETLMESELFGHEKGAFTGAVARKPGKFELAAEGTLFLDEIGELGLPLQAKLLRVLQDGTFARVGGTQSLVTSARVIAATNRDLTGEVRAGRFREDLYYRLNTVRLRVPPLRERYDDIPPLVDVLLERIAAELHRPRLRATAAALRALQQHDWPGNVRELQNVLTQCAIRARTPVLDARLLALPDGRPDQRAGPVAAPDRTLAEVEAEYIERVLQHTGNVKSRACAILGISRPALDRKLRRNTAAKPSQAAADRCTSPR